MKKLEQTVIEMINHLLNQHTDLAPTIEHLASQVSKRIKISTQIQMKKNLPKFMR